jgi:hypothetical protein
MRAGHLVAVFLLVLTSSASVASAQQRRPVPVRVDPLTASIGGRVTSNTGGPLRRAEVRAIGESGLTRMATTDAEGRYLVRDLPAGTFTLHVSKTGFVPLYFGQRRPFERRATIRLEQGGRADADVRLPRAGAITGRIYDAAGEPVLGARVQALRRRMVQGQPGLQAVGAADMTDDTGAYRIYGLPPGDYYVTATPRRIEDRAGRPIGNAVPGLGAPIFFPGTANRDLAQRITVDVSGEARGDMQLTTLTTARVTGTVLTSSGSPASGAMVTLVARDLDFATSGVGNGVGPFRLMDDAAADGSFELTGVPPGSFTLIAQTRPNLSAVFDIPNQRLIDPATRPMVETGSLPVAVEGDIAGLTVATAPSGTVTVTVVGDEGVTAPLPPTRISVRAANGPSDSMTMMHNGGNGLRDARLTLALAGPSSLTVEGLPDNWAVKAILLDDMDVSDRPIDLSTDRGSAVRVVLTDRVTELSGSVTSGSFAPAGADPDATVVIFTDDESKWTYPSRFVRSARANEDGTFQVNGLPPALDYRVVAVDYLEDGEETDPEFLKRMRDRAARFSLREGERRAIDLRLIQR